MGMTALKSSLLPDGMTYVVNGKERFVLDTADNLSLQSYLLKGRMLPSSDDAMKATFYLSDDLLKEFKDLQNAFGDIKNHCTNFYNVTYQDSVSLASAVVHCTPELKNYLNKIIQLVDLFLAGKLSEESAEIQISAVLKMLIDNLTKYAEEGEKVYNGVNAFYNETVQDNVCMNGMDGQSGLAKSYADRFGLNDQDIKNLNDDIAEATRELEDATRDYNHDVVVAATTPTYAWVFPFGTIPAVIVAGVYGKKATDAYKKMKELEAEIKTKNQELQQRMALIAGLALAKQQTKDIGDLIKSALTPIEKMLGCWKAMSDDLKDILETAETNIRDAALIFKDMGAQTVIDKWQSVAELADDYRKRAFITSVSENMAVNNIIEFPARNKIG